MFHAINLELSVFTKKYYFKNKTSLALKPLVSVIGRLVARQKTWEQTDGRNDKTTTVTLAAHARRGLITRRMLSIVGERGASPTQ